MTELLERRIVRIPLYGLFTLVAFLVALVVTFPDERVKQIIVVQAEKALNGDKTGADDERLWDVEIDDLDIWWFSGLELHNVKLKERWSDERKAQAERDAEEGAPPQSPLTVTIPRVAGRVSLLKSITNLGAGGVFTVDFDEGGAIEGEFVQKGSGAEIHVDFVEVDMFKAKLLESVTGVPGFGSLNGTIDLALDKRGAPSSGAISLKGSKLTVGPATVKTDRLPSMAYLEVPQTNFGNMIIEATIAKQGASPKLTFDTFNTVGRDVRMEVWGDTDLPTNKRAQADVDMRLQFDEGFVKENSLGPILNIQIFRAGKSNDNWYGISFKGRLSTLKPRGSMAAARGPSKSKAGAGAKAPARKKPTPKLPKRRNVQPKKKPAAKSP